MAQFHSPQFDVPRLEVAHVGDLVVEVSRVARAASRWRVRLEEVAIVRAATDALPLLTRRAQRMADLEVGLTFWRLDACEEAAQWARLQIEARIRHLPAARPRAAAAPARAARRAKGARSRSLPAMPPVPPVPPG